MKIITLTLLLIGFAFTLHSCNTIAGIGEDISQGGQSINKAAQKTSQAIDEA